VTNKINGQFVPLTRELLESKAWAAAGTHVRRLVDFLMLEHLRHGGQENGKLKAPRRQLRDYDAGARIPARFVSDIIDEAVALGIVSVYRGSRRRASTYGLTWLPLYDGTPASNRFTECDAAAETAIEAAKQAKRRSTSWRAAHGKGDRLGAQSEPKLWVHKVNPSMGAQSEPKSSVMGAQSEPIRPDFKGAQSEPTIEKALPGAEQDKKGSKEGSVGAEGRAVAGEADKPGACPGSGRGKPDPADVELCRWPLGGGCDKPAFPGSNLCARHA
jgi:hypothetical protein